MGLEPSGPRVIVPFRTLKAQPWANGAGATTELLSYTASQDLAEGLAPFRLSIAALDHPAEFSLLPGVDRTFTPVGSAVRLAVDGRLHTVEDGASLGFPGEAEVEITDLAHGCFAVNLMSRRGGGRPAPTAGVVPAAAERGTPAGPAEPLLWVNLEQGAGRFDLMQGPLGTGRALGVYAPSAGLASPERKPQRRRT